MAVTSIRLPPLALARERDVMVPALAAYRASARRYEGCVKSLLATRCRR